MKSFLLILIPLTSAIDILINPDSNCLSSCPNTLPNSYKHISAVYNNIVSNQDYVFLLVSGSTSPNFLPNAPSAAALLPIDQIATKPRNIIIRPLYCEDNIVKANSALNTRCINSSSTTQIELEVHVSKYLYAVSASFERISFKFVETFYINSNSAWTLAFAGQVSILNSTLSGMKYAKEILESSSFMALESFNCTSCVIDSGIYLSRFASGKNIYMSDVKFTNSNLTHLVDGENITLNSLEITNSTAKEILVGMSFDLNDITITNSTLLDKMITIKSSRIPTSSKFILNNFNIYFSRINAEYGVIVTTDFDIQNVGIYSTAILCTQGIIAINGENIAGKIQNVMISNLTSLNASIFTPLIMFKFSNHKIENMIENVTVKNSNGNIQTISCNNVTLKVQNIYYEENDFLKALVTTLVNSTISISHVTIIRTNFTNQDKDSESFLMFTDTNVILENITIQDSLYFSHKFIDLNYGYAIVKSLTILNSEFIQIDVVQNILISFAKQSSSVRLENISIQNNLFRGQAKDFGMTLLNIESTSGLTLTNFKFTGNKVVSINAQLIKILDCGLFQGENIVISENYLEDILALILENTAGSISQFIFSKNILKKLLQSQDSEFRKITSFTYSNISINNYELSNNIYDEIQPSLIYAIDGCQIILNNGTIQLEEYYGNGYLIQLWSSNITGYNMSFDGLSLSDSYSLVLVTQSSAFDFSSLKMTNFNLKRSGNLFEVRSHSFLSINDFTADKISNNLDDYAFFLGIWSSISIENAIITNSPKITIGFKSSFLLKNISYEQHYIESYQRKGIILYESSGILNDFKIKTLGPFEFQAGFIDISSSTLEINKMQFDIQQDSLESLLFKLSSSNLYLNNSQFNKNGLSKKYSFLESANGDILSFDNCYFELNKITMMLSFLNFFRVSNSYFNIIGVLDQDFSEMINLAKVELVNITFSSGPQKSKLIYCSSCSNILLDGLHISNLDNQLNTIKIDNSDLTSSTIIMKNLNLTNNTANLVTGIVNIKTSTNSILIIENSHFELNRAVSMSQALSSNSNGKGGVFYIDTPNDFFINNCKFINNTATVFGGAIYALDGIPIFDDRVLFVNNTADGRPNNLGTPVYQITPFAKRISSNPNPINKTMYSIEKIGNGIAIGELYLYLVDKFGQIVYEDSRSTLIFNTVISGLSISQMTFTAKGGAFDLTQVSFTYKELSSVNISFTVDSEIITGGSNQIQMMLSFRACSLGEYRIGASCQECPVGSYSFDMVPTVNGTCKSCQSMMQCRGGAKVTPKSGFWRLNITADQFIRCLPTTACVQSANESLTETLCAPGHQGNACSGCIDGYGKASNLGMCYDCKENVGIYFSLIFIILCNAFTVSFAGISPKTFYMLKDKSDVLEKRGRNHPDPLGRQIFIRILISYLQTITILTSMPLDWPSAMVEAADVNKHITITDSDVFRMDCFYSKYSSLIPKPYLKALMMNMLPILFFIIIMIRHLIVIKMKKLSLKEEIFIRIKCSLAVICFIFQSAIIQEDLKLLQCINIYREDSPIYFNRYNTDVECWTSQHYNFVYILIIPSLLIWVLLIPAYFIKCSMKKNDEKVRNDLSVFFSAGYETDKRYWELFILLRKYALISLAAFGGSLFQIRFAMFLLVGSHAFLSLVRPYKRRIYFKYERYAIILAWMTTMIGIYSQISNKSDTIWDFLTAIIIMANFYFIIRVIGLIITPMIKEKRIKNPKIDSILKPCDMIIDKISYMIVGRRRLRTSTDGANLEKLKYDSKHLGSTIMQEGPPRLSRQSIDEIGSMYEIKLDEPASTRTISSTKDL